MSKSFLIKSRSNTAAGFPEADYAVSGNRVIITKIGVNAPIVESKSAEYGLSKGSWRIPESSTPDKGGNTVITGHREAHDERSGEVVGAGQRRVGRIAHVDDLQPARQIGDESVLAVHLDVG